MNSVFDKIQLNILFKRGYFSFLFALLTVIILPIHVQYLPLFMIMWGICWFLENYSRIDMIWNSRSKYKVLFILFISYYIWQIAGLLYTTDIKLGLLNLFGRLSLVLFPFVLISPGEMIKKKAKILIKIFALSTFFFILFCFGYALYRSVSVQEGLWIFNPHPKDFPWMSYFYSSYLTITQHPSYIAMYALLSVFICFESWFDYSIKLTNRVYWLIIGSLLLISQYFLSSRAGILISLILVPFYLIITFNRLGKKRNGLLWILLTMIALLPVIVKNQRIDYIYDSVFHKRVGYYEGKLDPRFLIWKSGLKIAKENLLFGVGIGDVRSELVQEYKRIGEENMAKERFNAHNQFLEVLLENGIIGLTLFISIFILMFYIALSDKNHLFELFILMIFIFFQFETVLYRFAGVSFFSLFSFLLIYSGMNLTKGYERSSR